MADTREYLLYSDATMSNPNGDMINDNRPRQDERTYQLEMSDVRIKRYVRDELDAKGEKVFVKPTKNDKGLFIDCKGVAAKVIKDEKIKKDQLEDKLKQEYKDVKLFGAVITEPKFNIHGPLQIVWSKSLHECDIVFAQGTSVFTGSKSEAKQGTTWSKYYTPYALFKTYMVYNDMIAKRQNIDVSEDDLEEFKDVLISGIRNYKSTSKNQMPRLLVEVIYNKNYIDGELDYIDVKKKKQDLEIRSIEEFSFDLKPLLDYYERKKDIIKKINIYKHPKVELLNINEEFNVFDI
ncbi:type I-B CRISPR-associated protein Cas7/Csh2 [Tepidibacter formicigenes]|jgi:CRISPR-associated protein Csh2|uniref:CRISPR-associated protein, Csh2 family n=1 Tax=Tepidibacter formicigenes DSM 15518 TaxID=1123349 RepID=A0A1M6LMF3_9FIRM|nr:type I-B CRISPR-associated protein Cas7/Csh2 [Tepidibacter formicigenes]SHJ72396.1 CRISPR-associated protein, Csh2 family [Tepidibacter formicigenes DSM 15518]